MLPEPKSLSVDYIRPLNNASTSFGPCTFQKTTRFENELLGSATGSLTLHSHDALKLISDTLLIDCTGCTLINTGSIATDPDVITVLSPYVQTVGNASVALITYATDNNCVYDGDITVIGKDVAGISDNYTYFHRVKCATVAGVATCTMLKTTFSHTGTDVTVACVPTTAGNSLIIPVTGEAGLTLRWKCVLHLFRNN